MALTCEEGANATAHADQACHPRSELALARLVRQGWAAVSQERLVFSSIRTGFLLF